jgi:hypothetical protein
MSENRRTGMAKKLRQPARLNYYNYFTEIEETFIRRRGKHLFLGTIDWALMESWKEMGVPLHVVLRGIETAFDSYEARPRKRSVKTLMYCQEEVEAQYAEWLESQLGANDESYDGDSSAGAEDKSAEDESLPFARKTILEHLAHVRSSLSQLCDERKPRVRVNALCEAFSRAASRLEELEKDFAKAKRPDAQRLEESLTRLEKMLDDAICASLPAKELAAARAETEAQLQPYRSRMEDATYQQTFENMLFKRLREQYKVPRLSLFYL